MHGESVCAACGSLGLRPHLRVRGELGPAGLIPTTEQFGTALGDIARCLRCGHMQVDPMPTAATLDAAYAAAASEDYIEQEAGQRETARRALALIEAHAPRPAGRPRAILDLGCWVGFLLSEAQARGWRATGVEPSAFGAGYARGTLGLDVRQCGLLEADLPAGAYDAVTMGDLIEHLPDPAAALAKVAGLLAPGGVLWMAIPDAGSPLARVMGRRWWSVIPTHVQYFTRGSVATLLSRAGFEVLETRTAPKAFTVAYYLGRLGGYAPPLARGLVAAARRGGVAERMWAPDFGDRMAVIARLGASPPGVQ